MEPAPSRPTRTGGSGLKDASQATYEPGGPVIELDAFHRDLSCEPTLSPRR